MGRTWPFRGSSPISGRPSSPSCATAPSTTARRRAGCGYHDLHAYPTQLIGLITGSLDLMAALADGSVVVDGDAAQLAKLVALSHPSTLHSRSSPLRERSMARRNGRAAEPDPEAQFRRSAGTGRELVDIPTETGERAETPPEPRAAGVAGILFALMFGAIVVLFRSVLPLDPRSAGTLLTDAGDRRDLDFALGLIPFCGIFFLWFLGAVGAHIGQAEDRFFATIVLGSGLLFIAMLFVFGALFGALISLAGLYEVTRRSRCGDWVGKFVQCRLRLRHARRCGLRLVVVIAYRLPHPCPTLVVVGFAGALLLLFASPTTPWLQLVFPFWVLLVSINILVLAYRSRNPTTP